MPKATKTKATKATKAQAKSNSDSELQGVLDKEPTALQKAYAEWLEETTGYKPDLRTLYLTIALRTTFRKSEENQEFKASRAEAREQAKAEREARKAEGGGRKSKKEKATAVEGGKKRRSRKRQEAETDAAEEAATTAKKATRKRAAKKKAAAEEDDF